MSDWNIYPFHFSDWDNWSRSDTEKCINIMKKKLVPWSNQFSYAQVNSPYGSGQFYGDLETGFPSDDKVVLSKIPDRDAIMDSIKELLSGGR